MRKPLLPASVAVVRWIAALVVLVAVAVVVTGRNLPAYHASALGNAEMTAAQGALSQSLTPDARARVRANFAALPLAFEANQGQTDPRVKYMARSQGYQVFLTANEAVFAMHSSAPKPEGSNQTMAAKFVASGQLKSAAIRMQFVGGNASAQVAAGKPLPGTINYFIGNDSSKWHSGVKQYSAVTYSNVYPGVDVTYHGQQQQLEFDFIVSPGANPAPITASFEGAKKIATDGAGNLLLSSAAGDVLLHKPVAYQEKNGGRKQIDARFVLEADNRVRFDLGNYDRSRQLVIDPSLSYATYLGGSAEDDGYAIAVDSTLAAYVTGQTASTDFPTASPEQGSNKGGFDVFVTKFAPGGASLDYSTYVGGSGNDSGNAIAVSSSGVYVAGGTASTNFPTAGTPFQKDFGGGNLDAFVFELSSSGGTLIYSTYLGGTGDDFADGVALDTAGNTYLVGSTNSPNFPIAPNPGALQTSLNGASNGFVTELNPSGGAVVYSTYLGGGTGDLASAVAVDSSGNAYVTGVTYSTAFPVTSNVVQKTCGSCTGTLSNAFVSVIQPGGTAFVYSTFLGGSNADSGLGIAVDSSQDAYVTGIASSTNFPTKSALQGSYGGGLQDAFVTALNPAGNALLYSTYLGGSQSDGASSIAVDENKNAYVTGQTASGQTSSPPFPLANATQPTIGGGTDAFVTEISPAGALLFSTFLGGSQDEDSPSAGPSVSPLGGIAVDSAGANIYVTGNTFSTNFPTVNPYQGTIGGGVNTTVADAFVASYATGSSSSGSFTIGNGTLTPASGSPGVSAAATITVTSTGGFNSAVTLECSVSPSVTNGPTCTFSNPGNLVTPPANGAVTATLNVATTAASARLESPSLFHRSGGPFYALLLPVGLALLGTGASSSRRRKLFGGFLLGLLLAAVLLMPGCSSSGKGGGGGSGGTPANTYTITVTGTGGSVPTVTGSPAITLTVN